MFERYTKAAKDVLYSARQIAGQFGGPDIRPEHLLMALLHKDPAVVRHLLSSNLFRKNRDFTSLLLSDPESAGQGVLQEIAARTAQYEAIPPSEDIRLSDDCIYILKLAAVEADRLRSPSVGTEHLLLGLIIVISPAGTLLREEYCARQVEVRQTIAKSAQATAATSQPA